MGISGQQDEKTPLGKVGEEKKKHEKPPTKKKKGDKENYIMYADHCHAKQRRRSVKNLGGEAFSGQTRRGKTPPLVR